MFDVGIPNFSVVLMKLGTLTPYVKMYFEKVQVKVLELKCNAFTEVNIESLNLILINDVKIFLSCHTFTYITHRTVMVLSA